MARPKQRRRCGSALPPSSKTTAPPHPHSCRTDESHVLKVERLNEGVPILGGSVVVVTRLELGTSAETTAIKGDDAVAGVDESGICFFHDCPGRVQP